MDILGDAASDRYQASLEILLADKQVDGVLVLLTPQAMTDPTACAEAVVLAASATDKPVLACWMGASLVSEGRQRFTLSNTEAKAILRAFQIPVSPSINASSAADALIAAESVGLPVAMKINSPDVPHKTDVGGVLSQNGKMLRLCNNLGFRSLHANDDPEITVVRRHL